MAIVAPEASTATPTIEAQRPHSATTVQAPTEGVQATAFFRAFAGRVRETVAPEHARTADLFGRVTDSVIEHGATPVLAEALASISRTFDGSDTPAALASRVLARTAVEAASRWTITATNGVSISGYLPPWAEGNLPTEDGVDPGDLMTTADDVSHVKWYSGQLVDADLRGFAGKRDVGTAAILCPQINCEPFHKDPAKRIPYAVVELAEGSDNWTGDLDPQGLVDLAVKLRTQADILDQVAADLTAARADWAKNGRQA